MVLSDFAFQNTFVLRVFSPWLLDEKQLNKEEPSPLNINASFTLNDIASIHHVITLHDGRMISIAGEFNQIASLIFNKTPTNLGVQTPISLFDEAEPFSFDELQSPEERIEFLNEIIIESPESENQAN